MEWRVKERPCRTTTTSWSNVGFPDCPLRPSVVCWPRVPALLALARSHVAAILCAAGIEDLKEKREEVNRQILQDEEEKQKIQNDLRILTERCAGGARRGVRLPAPPVC